MDTMINATGFQAKKYDNEVTGKVVIPAEVRVDIKDKEVAQGLLELFRLGVERSDNMKKIEAYARGYNELSKAIKEAWGQEMERGFDPAREYLKTQHLEAEYECRTAHKAIKRGATSYNEYEQGYEEEEEQ